MRNLVFGILFTGLTSLMYAQPASGSADEVALEEVTVSALNMDYLKEVQDFHLTKWVRDMQRKAASYDVKNSGLFKDELKRYEVRFIIPRGNIRAVYDEDGKILSTIERYKNVSTPPSLRQSVYMENPGWTMEKNAYMVNYDRNKGAKRTYKAQLRKGDDKRKLKYELEYGHTM